MSKTVIKIKQVTINASNDKNQEVINKLKELAKSAYVDAEYNIGAEAEWSFNYLAKELTKLAESLDAD